MATRLYSRIIKDIDSVIELNIIIIIEKGIVESKQLKIENEEVRLVIYWNDLTYITILYFQYYYQIILLRSQIGFIN
jgi:hypothetical protein